MYIQHISYRGIGSKHTYKLRILCKYIIIIFCCQLFFCTATRTASDNCNQTTNRLQTDYKQTTNVSSSHVFPCLSCFLTVHASLSNIHESVIISNCLLQNCKNAKKISGDTSASPDSIFSKYTLNILLYQYLIIHLLFINMRPLLLSTVC